MTSVAPQFRAYLADLARDRELLLKLWRSGLGHGGNPQAKLQWFYERHPGSLPEVLVLTRDDEPIGAATLARRDLRLGSVALRGALLADFVVVPEHREFFPALFLQREVRRVGLARYDVLFGMPNAQSEAIVKRAGYRAVGMQVRWARVVRIAAFLEQRLPSVLASFVAPAVDASRLLLLHGAAVTAKGLRVRWQERPDERFDGLAGALAPWIAGSRDASYLAWRFADCPLREYRFACVEDRAGKLVAYAVCDSHKEGLVVSDFLADPRMPASGKLLWSALAGEAHRRGCRNVSVFLIAPPAAQPGLRSGGLVEREGIPIYAAWRPEFEPLLAKAPWYLTLADADT